MLKLKGVSVGWLGTFALIALGSGCSGDDTAAGTGTAGAGGSNAGASGAGGSSTGGAAGTTAGTAGKAGGGGSSTAGDAEAGIVTGSGGSSGAGGAGGDDGSVPSDAPPPKPDGSQGVRYTFDVNGLDGWHYTAYGSTPLGTPNPPGDPNNLANRSAPLAWDGTNDSEGQTDASGSLRASVPFTTATEQIDIQAFSTANVVRDWTGYIVTAKVKLVSGGNFNPACPLQAWLYISTSPAYTTTFPLPTNLSPGNWVTLTYDMADAANTTSLINQMGIQITTGASCPFDGGAPEAGSSDAARDGALVDSSDAATADSAVDGASVDGAADAASTDGGAGQADAGDAGDGAVGLPVQATTAVILIDSVIVSVK